MSYEIFDLEPPNENDLWTTGRLIDEISLDLMCTTERIHTGEGKIITTFKYYYQAREKMKWIPMTNGNGKGRMSFVIHLSDLTEKVRKELDDYYKDAGEEGLALILKLAVGRIFKNLDPVRYDSGAMKYLTVRLIK
jgi:hypothetical protein